MDTLRVLLWPKCIEENLKKEFDPSASSTWSKCTVQPLQIEKNDLNFQVYLDKPSRICLSNAL